MFIDVALPLPLPTPLTYSVPDDLEARAVPGARVVVPVREKEMVGIVTATGRPAPKAKARPVLAAPDAAPLLDSSLLQLAEWTGSWYAASPGLVLRAMLPAALFSESIPVVRRIGDLPGSAGAASPVLDLLGGTRGASGVRIADIRRVGGAAGIRLIHRLAGDGVVELVTLPPRTRDPEKTERLFTLTDTVPGLAERDLLFARSPRQRAAVEAIEGRGG
ncbi:MAG TPA: hypothetical protein VGI92_05695, partial [Gemmatimonadales bacterium]